MAIAQQDWRSISDDKEKYQAYLCSRDWAKLKKAVHARADGKCERCGLFDIGAVHHVTYARKYEEDLADLAGWCKHCHAHEHAEHWFDPKEWNNRIERMRQMGQPAPFEAFECRDSLREDIVMALTAIDQLMTLGDIGANMDFVEPGIEAIQQALPFAYNFWVKHNYALHGPHTFYHVAEASGFVGIAKQEWRRPRECADCEYREQDDD